jgi:hypothetical protein
VPNFAALNSEFGALITTIDSSDTDPTPAEETAYNSSLQQFNIAVAAWNDLVSNALPGLNATLAKQDISALPAALIAIPSDIK